MATRNQSSSYRREREWARRILTGTHQGQESIDLLKRNAPGGDASAIFDDDDLVDWEELIKEHRGNAMIAANCREAREAFDLARQSSTIMAAPSPSKAKMRRIFSPPAWYVLRKQAELGDPEYWNRPVNIYREALANPQWATVPAEYLRAALDQYLPKGQRVA
jgi:hypothetical protein